MFGGSSGCSWDEAHGELAACSLEQNWSAASLLFLSSTCALDEGDKGQCEYCPSAKAVPPEGVGCLWELLSHPSSKRQQASGAWRGQHLLASLRSYLHLHLQWGIGTPQAPGVNISGEYQPWWILLQHSYKVNHVRVLLLMENWFYRLLKVFINDRHYGALNLYPNYNTGE